MNPIARISGFAELRSARPRSRASQNRKHGGFLRYLWARQDEPAGWPSWDGANGEAARRRLAAVSIDEMLRALSVRLQERAGTLFTPTGKVRTGGLLELAERERDAAGSGTGRTACETW